MIDMTNVTVLLRHAQEGAHGLDQVDITDTETSREKAAVRTEKAEVSRQLLELADILALTEQLVRNEYWIVKGRGYDITLEAMNG